MEDREPNPAEAWAKTLTVAANALLTDLFGGPAESGK